MSTSMKIKHRIWKMKVLLAKKIMSQERILAKKIYEEQLKNDWPWLSLEVKEICREIGVNNLNEKDVSKEELEEAIFFHNKEMELEMSSYDKSINRFKMDYKGSYKNNLSCEK